MFNYHGITIDYSRDQRLDEFAHNLLREFYMLPSESSPQESFARPAIAFCGGDMALAQRIYDYVSLGWAMYASPVLSNAPAPGQLSKSLPISCYLTHVGDSLESLINHSNEIRWLSVKGGGVGGHWSDVRAVSKKAPGPIPFLKTVDADMTAYSQGVTRRGSYAAYLDVSHPDIQEFINIRVPSGGDPNRKCLNLHNAVNVTDAFMQAVANGKPWNLVDPDTNQIRNTVSARDLWHQILEVRMRTGEPYIHFIDTANRSLPPSLKAAGLKINGSNLCIEIELPTAPDYTAVCCLSSLVLEFYEDWKSSTIVEDFIIFLDNVLQYFIDCAPPQLVNAVRGASSERSLGLGALGFHSFLQKQKLPWAGLLAKLWNREMFALIKERAVKQTKLLAAQRGPYKLCIDEPRRNAHLLAVAPNANSAIIAGSSASIEPIKSNAYVHRMRAGSYLVKNKYLQLEMDEMGLLLAQQEALWQDITLNQGSIQHLDIFTLEQKERFKTAFEIDQAWIVEHAADRQEWICQGQSINLFFPAGTDRSYLNYVHMKAWRAGLKGLYYLRTNTSLQADKVGKALTRVALSDYVNKPDECLACQG